MTNGIHGSRGFLQKTSPLVQADRIISPLLVAEERNDLRMPHPDAENIGQVMHGNDQPV
jgi:hypothetical protein